MKFKGKREKKIFLPPPLKGVKKTASGLAVCFATRYGARKGGHNEGQPAFSLIQRLCLKTRSAIELL